MSVNTEKNKRINTVLVSIITLIVTAVLIVVILVKSGIMPNPFVKNEKPVPEKVYENEAESFVISSGHEVEQFWSVASVYVPQEFDDYYNRYNALQKSQGYDLEPYMGQKCQEHIYLLKDLKIDGRNTYMTVLVFDGEIIGSHISTMSGSGELYNINGELYE